MERHDTRLGLHSPCENHGGSALARKFNLTAIGKRSVVTVASSTTSRINLILKQVCSDYGYQCYEPGLQYPMNAKKKKEHYQG